MKKNKQLILFLLIFIISFNLILVSKASAYYASSPSFTVTIPSNISLSYNGSTGKWSGTGSITASGNISTGDTVSVTSPASLNLLDGNGKTCLVSITFGTNGTKLFSAAEINGSALQSLTATTSNNNMAAGTWSGTMTFTVEKITHVHSYTSSITKAATCTENGVKTYTCSICGYSYTEAIAALGHDLHTVTKSNVLCGGTLSYTFTTGTGAVTVNCSVCGQLYSGQFVPYDSGGAVNTFRSVMNSNLAGKPHYKPVKCDICNNNIFTGGLITPVTLTNLSPFMAYFTSSATHTHSVCSRCGYYE